MVEHHEERAYGMSRNIEIKEGLWIVCMSCIGLLFIILLHQSGGIMAEYSETGNTQIPLSFWVLVTIYISLCISVFFLLNESTPIIFKITGCIITGIVPIVTILLIIINLLILEHQ